MKRLVLGAVLAFACSGEAPSAPPEVPREGEAEEPAPAEEAEPASIERAIESAAPAEPAEPPCAPKRCATSADSLRAIARAVRRDCMAAARAAGSEETWAERSTEYDSFRTIRYERRTGDEAIPEYATFRCQVGDGLEHMMRMVWLAFRDAAGWHACELARTDGDSIYVGDIVPRQVRLEQWIEGGAPELVVRVTDVFDGSDGGELSRSSGASLYVCGLAEGEGVCWGSIPTEHDSASGYTSCDADGESCEWSGSRRSARARVEPSGGDTVRVVPVSGDLFEERVVHVPGLACPPAP